MRPQLTQDERNLFVELCRFVLGARTLLVDDYPEPFSYFMTEDWERRVSSTSWTPWDR
jgi:hypothetical protein